MNIGGWAKRFVLYVLTTVMIVAALPLAAAADTNCSVNISPSDAPPGTEATFEFDVQNTGSEPITWIQVQQPDVNYDINGISQNGWTDATSNTGTTLTGSSIAPGDTYSFQLAMQTGPQEESAQNWSITTSSSGDGSGAVACGGQTATSIANPQAAPTPNGESNIGLTNVTPTTATVGWTSDTPSSSYVYYGTDTAYGHTAVDNSASYSQHNVTLTGLSPNTVYHYKVAGSDGNGNNYFSSDNTFITPEQLPPVVQYVTNTVTVQSNTPSTIPVDQIAGAHATVYVAPTPNDTTAPTVSLTSPLTHPFATAPVLTATAHDNAAVARIDFSVDGGRDWLPSYDVTGLGTQTATAQFTPNIIDDGNYSVMVRAIDGNGNVGYGASNATLVIDRLPPRVGNMVTSFGSQVLEPDSNGAVTLAVGSEYHVTTAAVGGPIMVNLIAAGANNNTKTFAMVQDPTTGLWSGAMSFEQGGTYKLSVSALDGAGNKTARDIGQISVVPVGKVVDKQGKAVSKAKVTLYYLEPSSKHWVVWDAKPYSQTNPQVSKNGSYSLMAPAGEYYLQASAPGYGTVITPRFRLDSPQSLSTVLKLPQHALLPVLNSSTGNSVAPFKLLDNSKSLLGTTVPTFDLPKINGGIQQSIDLNGKPTVISLINTWSPTGIDQLAALAAAQKNSDVSVVPLFEGERPEAVQAYIRLSGAHLDGITDPDNTLSQSLMTGFGPRHIFVDRSGHIKKVMVGVLSEQTILRELGGL